MRVGWEGRTMAKRDFNRRQGDSTSARRKSEWVDWPVPEEHLREVVTTWDPSIVVKKTDDQDA
jgi:hypothetical protein